MPALVLQSNSLKASGLEVPFSFGLNECNLIATKLHINHYFTCLYKSDKNKILWP